MKFGLAMCKIVLLSSPSGQIGHLAALPVARVFQLEHEPVKDIALVSLRLIGQIHKSVMKADHAGHLASIIERILIVRVFLYNKQRLSPHPMDLLILNMKQWEDMAFAQVCALVFLVVCHSTGFLISQDQEPVNYIAPGSFQKKNKILSIN